MSSNTKSKSDEKDLYALFTKADIDTADKATFALMVEACRIKRRLDALDRLLSGDIDSWIEITKDFSGPKLIIDKALTESRQQATVLRQTLSTIKNNLEREGVEDDGLFKFE